MAAKVEKTAAYENIGSSVEGKAIVPLNTVCVAMAFATQTLRLQGCCKLYTVALRDSVACLLAHLLFIKHCELN